MRMCENIEGVCERKREEDEDEVTARKWGRGESSCVCVCARARKGIGLCVLIPPSYFVPTMTRKVCVVAAGNGE